MAIPAATIPGLQAEGIVAVDDLEEFNDDDLSTLMSNLRRPAGTTTDQNGNVVPNPSYVLGAKSLKRLKIAAAAVRYYACIG